MALQQYPSISLIIQWKNTAAEALEKADKTEYTYDKAGRLIHICQHGQAEEADRITQYERDAFGQIVCIRDALGGEEQFHYDALGRIIEKIDKEGLSIFYTYTADSRPESILYSDGNRAELEYTPLRQLAVIKDWLGETRINRDNQGNPVSITNHKGETVHYQWGSMGERQKITYPDGTKVSWKYDGLLRPIQMNRIAENKEPLWIDYKYNKQGHLAEKKSAGGYRTLWKYNESGQLEELLHEDAAGFLDKFHYTYDAMGNKTAIQKQRRGLPEESGCYQYSYDKLQRLIGVEKDGKHIRSYQYDTFSNRIEMEDNTKGIKNIYQYNALNQLVEQEIWETPDITTKINTFINGNDIDNIKHNNNANILHKTFTYDKRGNLTGEYQEDALLHGYYFNHMNRLEKAWNHQGEEAQYFYNALGQRTGRTANGEREDYLLDLTKPYHNLLELQKGKQTQTFFWDFNAAVMEDEKRNLQYYLQDDLGSPLRVLYRNGYGEAYGYDEFGTELYESDSIKEEKTRKKYGKQGENQPFGYTGYRYDNISGSYFAQAREYMPEAGRFMGEDIISGRSTIPKTFNRYGYCWLNPIRYIDLNGKDPITPQQARDMAWEFWEDQVQKVVSEIENEIDSIQNDINETIDAGIQMAKDAAEAVGNGIKTTVKNTTDNVMNITNNGVQLIRNILKNQTGTLSVAVDTSFIPGIWQFDFMQFISVDTKGNVGLQAAFNGGVTPFEPSKRITFATIISNAPTIFNLEDLGFTFGATFEALDSIFMGAEFNILGDINNINNKTYYGMTIFGGMELGYDIHTTWGNTSTVYYINIFNLWDKIYSNYKKWNWGEKE